MTSTLPRLEGVISSGIYRLPNRAGCCEREFQMESGAAVAPVENFNRAAMLLNDTVAHGEPETGALARGLGGEERIVDAVDVLGGYAGAGVRDFHFYPNAIRPGADFQ